MAPWLLIGHVRKPANFWLGTRHKKILKMKLILTTAISASLLLPAGAAPTFLWLRQEPGCVTPQMVESTAGTNSTSLPFAGTTTYDFFSAPLNSVLSLATSDKGGGVIYMRNTSTVGAYDFGVSGRMQYFDYDPANGSDTLIVDTGASPQKNVNHGQTVNWAIPNVLLPAARTVAAGHLLHVAVTIGLVSGNPGSFGQLVYNGPSGTQALFPQNQTITLPLGSPAPISAPCLSCSAADGCVTVSFPGFPGYSYLVQATTNLSNPVWETLATTNANGNGLVIFKDVDSVRYAARFYRSLVQ